MKKQIAIVSTLLIASMVFVISVNLQAQKKGFGH